MPDYKNRKIELIPRRRDDGTWYCPYRIIEFRTTCWGFHKGTTLAKFESRDAAAAAGLEDAKRVVDALESPEQHSQTQSSTVLGRYGKKMQRLFALPRR